MVGGGQIALLDSDSRICIKLLCQQETDSSMEKKKEKVACPTNPHGQSKEVAGHQATVIIENVQGSKEQPLGHGTPASLSQHIMKRMDKLATHMMWLAT